MKKKVELKAEIDIFRGRIALYFSLSFLFQLTIFFFFYSTASVIIQIYPALSHLSYKKDWRNIPNFYQNWLFVSLPKKGSTPRRNASQLFLESLRKISNLCLIRVCFDIRFFNITFRNGFLLSTLINSILVSCNARDVEFSAEMKDFHEIVSFQTKGLAESQDSGSDQLSWFAAVNRIRENYWSIV